jgi:peptide/nickel transport system permease protein
MENIDKKMPEYLEEDIYSERSLMQETWRRLKKSKLAMAGMYFLILLCVLSVVTFVIDVVTDKTFYNEHVIAQDLVNRLKGPSVNHIFGTDEFGRDIFLRIIWGTRYSLFMGIFAIGFAIVIGGIIGAIAGFYGRVTDNILMRFMDILLAMPPMLLALTVVAALGTGLLNVVIAVAISYIPTYARVLRASVLTVKDKEYIESARAVGASNAQIIIRFVIPNSLAPIIVQGTLGVAGAILTIASLSFVGLGVQPPLPEWGLMLSNARTYMREAWHITVIPGIFIMLTILSLNLMGDGLRDALDPRLKN